MNSNKHITSSLSGIYPFITRLNHLAKETYDHKIVAQEYDYVLNGGPSKELRQSVSIEFQRKYGTFFTGTELGNRLIDEVDFLNDRQVLYDPCCGMGDLLLAAGRKLPLRESLYHTLQYWGQMLYGTDIHSEFIAATKARLVILARKRHKTSLQEKLDLAPYFPNIRVADAFLDLNYFNQASTILLNPPFGKVLASNGCNWGMGHISEAAKFIIHSIESSNPGTSIQAILPDVLRSGTNYKHWRNKVYELAEVHRIEFYGLFDKLTNVDVFMVKLIKKETSDDSGDYKWPDLKKDTEYTLSSLFDVNVGRVVPHRNKNVGTNLNYIHPRCVPPWSVVSEFTEVVKHNLKPFIPPFVVIRRTSRPGDQFRAVGSVISGKKPVAVENHFIICKPKDNKLVTCKKLLSELKSDQTNKFLDHRIRCRHLTVDSVKMIPLSILKSMNNGNGN